MNKPLTNLPASVRQRLLNLSRKEKREFQEVLTRYALERFLYRLGKTPYGEQFILKGALLFVVWSEEIHRTTQDMDLLGRGDPSPERLVALFQEVCEAEVEADGLTFEAASVAGRFIREDNLYGGVRITLRAQLEQARIPLQIDIGFGDAVFPEPEEVDFPALLDVPAPHLRIYRKETSIAEKFLDIVTLGADNTRMKDYFDLWLLARDYAFAGETLKGALAASFARQRVAMPQTIPVGLTQSFADNPAKRSQWQGFVRQRVALPGDAPDLEEVVASLREFLLPVLNALALGDGFSLEWPPGGSWQETNPVAGEAGEP
jgi:hypothetical protein